MLPFAYSAALTGVQAEQHVQLLTISKSTARHMSGTEDNRTTGLRRAMRPLRCPVVVVGLLTVMMPAAEGSCGSYLYRKGQPVSAHPMGSLIAAGSVEAALNEGEPVDRECSGPNCRRSSSPGMPAPLPAPVDSGGFSKLSMLSGNLDPAGGSDETMRHPASEWAAFFEPQSVFRPPA